MKLLGLSILRKEKPNAVLLNMSSFSFFQRFNVQETICALYVWHASLAEMVVMNSDYPFHGAVALPEKVLDEFSKQVDKTEWPVGSLATVLNGYLRRSQNLGETDPMSKAWAELEATKVVLHNTTKPLLEQGEKLDELVSKSEVLETV
ncbi:synaptobrevin homolog YKT6-like [Mustela erminea]|uniref:synaptobrevin homolog YKT6-like n=1 Tax=Mustela erminea TaxID=36723 RepID=UPI001386941B|nr:synaptobrevin homolog YKT6-like [Mustela erminea]